MDKETRKIELLKAKIDYIKTYIMPSLSIVLVAFIFFMQLDESQHLGIEYWISLIIMLIFLLLALHMLGKHIERQKQLVKLLSKK